MLKYFKDKGKTELNRTRLDQICCGVVHTAVISLFRRTLFVDTEALPRSSCQQLHSKLSCDNIKGWLSDAPKCWLHVCFHRQMAGMPRVDKLTMMGYTYKKNGLELSFLYIFLSETSPPPLGVNHCGRALTAVLGKILHFEQDYAEMLAVEEHVSYMPKNIHGAPFS